MTPRPLHGCPVKVVGLELPPFPNMVVAAQWAGRTTKAMQMAVTHGWRCGGYWWVRLTEPKLAHFLKTHRWRNRPIRYCGRFYAHTKHLMAKRGITRRQVEQALKNGKAAYVEAGV